MARQKKGDQKNENKNEKQLMTNVVIQDNLDQVAASDTTDNETSAGDLVIESHKTDAPATQLTEPIVDPASPTVLDEADMQGGSPQSNIDNESGVLTDEDLFSDENAEDSAAPGEPEVKVDTTKVSQQAKARKLIVCFDEDDKNKFLQLCNERHVQYEGDIILSAEMSSISLDDDVKFAFSDILKISHYGENVLREAFQIKDKPKFSEAKLDLSSLASTDIELTESSSPLCTEIDDFVALISKKIENKRSFKIVNF